MVNYGWLLILVVLRIKLMLLVRYMIFMMDVMHRAEMLLISSSVGLQKSKKIGEKEK